MQYPYRPPFDAILPAEFIERPNRFVVHCRLNSGEEVRAFLPNPGRLQELLLPAVTVFLVPEPPDTKRKTRFTMVAVEGEDAPIFLHTHVNNDVARHLLTHDLVPGLEGATIVRAEVPLGRSRFDFLLEHDGAPVYVEVKSCTLFGNGVAMFPDAITERGRRHLEELAELAESGTRAAVLFVVHSGAVDYFMPDYHTDLAFSKTLLAVRDLVPIIPMAVAWRANFSIGTTPRRLPIPWAHIEREAEDRGNYMIVCRVKAGSDVQKGFHIITGWCPAGLRTFLQGAKRNGRGLSQHAARIVAQAVEIEVYPIVASVDRHAELYRSLGELPGTVAFAETSGDSALPEGVPVFDTAPTSHREFHHLLARFRMAHPS